MSTIASIPPLTKPPRAVITGNILNGSLATAGKNSFVTGKRAIISVIIIAGKRLWRKEALSPAFVQ